MALILARAIAIGLALGVVTGIPLGVVNIAVIELGSRDRRGATWLGVGGAIADACHTLLAIVGYGALITRSVVATRVLAVVSAAIVAGYALVVLRRRRPTAPPVRAAPASRLRALLGGVSLTLPNPGALLAWTVVAAALFPRASHAEAIAAALGVLCGSALWFATLAHVASRTRLVDQPWAARAVAVVLLALAAFAIIRSL